MQKVPEKQCRHRQDDHDLYAPLRRKVPQGQRPEAGDDPDLSERADEIQGPHLLDITGVRPEERYPRRARHEPEDYDCQVAGYAEQEDRSTGPAQ